jgi:glycosyltransferase involved in cell wall biosynthesis/Flp pilus assembly protein TadD
MALKIVRATDDERLANPLRTWYAGRHEEALEALARPDAARYADEAPKLYELALAEDLSRAGAIGAALTAWDDETAAYRVLKRICEGLIDEIGPAGADRWAQRGIGLVAAVRPWLERRPAEPVLLNYLGVALYGLNEPALALKVLQAAERLDPTLEHLAGTIAAARERIKRPIRTSLAPREWMAINGFRAFLKTLPGSVARDRLGDVRISLCMIVRDEEEMLPDCLASCRDGVDEMVIVDTGSTDRTIEIAESFGATVLHFPWNGSFSDARNHGIDAATGTHVLWLDADERLEEGDALRLRALAAQPYREAHWLVETNFTGQDEVGTAANHLALRLWRNRAPYRFSGAIHEQIRVSMPIDLPERFAISSLRIRHYGYLKARIEQKNKHERNLELLLAELERTPSSPFTHFNLGTEYVAMGDGRRARTHLERSLELIVKEPGWHEIAYASLLVTRLIGIRRQAGDIAAADALAEEMLRVYPTFTDLVFERGLCARERRELDTAAGFFGRCLEMGDAPARFAGMVGRGSFLALAALASVSADAGDRDAAIAYLERSLAEYPQYLPAGLELADALLADPEADPAAVLARLEAAGNDQATWWLFLGTAFYERGHAELAEALFRRALTRAPGHPAATVGLAEALLTQHRYADLVAEDTALPQGTPSAIALARCRVLAAVAAGDASAAADGVERFAHGGDADELRFLQAFGGMASGDDPRSLDRGGATYAVQMLDALARLEEFDLFERLVPATQQAIGDPRTAALSLAELFAARGFYRLSGEWAMQAIELGGPEPRALAVLGKAAVAEGMFEDAVPVLEASLELDPTQGSLRALLASVRERLAA